MFKSKVSFHTSIICLHFNIQMWNISNLISVQPDQSLHNKKLDTVNITHLGFELLAWGI